MEKTLGEIRIRTDFIAAEEKTLVASDSIKQKTAELINLINKLPTDKDPELTRIKHIALISYEEACMWGVKAATK